MLPVKNPRIYEINTRVWLRELSSIYNKEINLENVPPQEWVRLKALGFDYIWLMGVWKPSLLSRKIALENLELKNEYDLTLPDWKEEDVVSSPYAIKDYSLNLKLGNDNSLVYIKKVLNHLDLGLILDFVPNHMACDHHWLFEYPQFFISTSNPEPIQNYFEFNNKYFAYGRDPNYEPWKDTLQLNYFNPETRQAMNDELLKISQVCDGVRCDMAMLILNDILNKTWKKEIQEQNISTPQEEFWPEAIHQVKIQKPDFIFISESYWNTGEYLKNLGFDFNYNKELYDLLINDSAINIKSYLTNFNQHHLCFIENHDEKRAVKVLGVEKSLAAAAIILVVPGAKLFHQGQLEGKTIKLPVQLQRKLSEPTNSQINNFYKLVLPFLSKNIFKNGKWQKLEIRGWDDNQSYQNLLAFLWKNEEELFLVAINYSQQKSDGMIIINEIPDTETLNFTEFFSKQKYQYSSEQIKNEGFYISLPAWGINILKIKAPLIS